MLAAHHLAAEDRLVPCVVEQTPKNERAWAIAVAAAHDWNDELTVILNSISRVIETLGRDHPVIPLLLDQQGAAQRCAWKAAGLLSFAASHGTKPGSARMEALIGLM